MLDWSKLTGFTFELSKKKKSFLIKNTGDLGTIAIFD